MRDGGPVAGLIAGGLIAILGFLTWALVFRDIPGANENSMTVLLGILSAQVSMVVGYYFGSTVGAKKQTETIDTLAKTAQSAGAALNPAADVTIEPGQAATVAATPDPESRL